jgi:hypothetical protein
VTTIQRQYFGIAPDIGATETTITAIVGVSLITPYKTVQAIGKSLVTPYVIQVFPQVGKSLSVKWTDRKIVGTSLVAPYRLAGTIGASLLTPYSIQSIVTRVTPPAVTVNLRESRDKERSLDTARAVFDRSLEARQHAVGVR